MIAEFSAVAKLFSDAVASIKGVRGAVANTKGLLSDLDIEKTRKSLRTIYFFQDGIVTDLKRIAQSKGTDIDAFDAIIEKLDASQNEVYRATEYFRSQSIKNNLNINLATAEKIQKVADLKNGIRVALRQYVVAIKDSKLSPTRLKELKKIERNINILRRDIEEVEAAFVKI
jgi:hypothetical protein